MAKDLSLGVSAFAPPHRRRHLQSETYEALVRVLSLCGCGSWLVVVDKLTPDVPEPFDVKEEFELEDAVMDDDLRMTFEDDQTLLMTDVRMTKQVSMGVKNSSGIDASSTGIDIDKKLKRSCLSEQRKEKKRYKSRRREQRRTESLLRLKLPPMLPPKSKPVVVCRHFLKRKC
ncbi:hypothetical protein MLD38_006557 [Melastoma candidum]|uniref:Uncharacterized protein n=1 Tax=Melastoma candidum TaxID=119954 RepID=A0ACB9RSG1_9MYRT|nr:hypothetical protein MLD38_006557 [Melastoma candidum]